MKPKLEQLRHEEMLGTWNVCSGKLKDVSRERPYVLYPTRPQGQDCPSPLELTSCHHVAQVADMQLKELMFAWFSFGLGMGMFTLCHCILDICNLLFDFQRRSRVCLESQLRLWTSVLLRNTGTVKIMKILGDALNVFCIVK